MAWWATRDLQNIVYKDSVPLPTNAKGKECFICDKKFTKNGVPRNLIWNYSTQTEFGLSGSKFSSERGNHVYTAVPIHVTHSDAEITNSLCAKAGVNGIYTLGTDTLIDKYEESYSTKQITNSRHSQIAGMIISK